MQSNSYVIRLYKILKERKGLLVYLPLAIYWLVIFIATSIPIDPMPKLFNAQDKFEHFAAYFILEILLALTLHFQNKFIKLKQNPILFSLILLTLYAALDEIHQYFIPGRYADIFDWSADVVGGILAILVIKTFLKRTSVLHTAVQ